MNLNMFKTFIKVVETQNISRTADEFELSQPAISKQIQTLEDYFGVLLLERTGRRLKPTEAGEVLYQCAREIVKNMEKTERLMDELADSHRGNLVLGASSIPGHYILPSLVKKYRDENPAINIYLEVSDTDKICNRVADREIDVGFVGGIPANRKLDSFKWLDDEIGIVVPKSHALAKRSELNLAEVLEGPWVIREKGSGTRRAFEETLQRKGIKKDELNIAIEAGSTETVLAMVEAGMGVAIMSRWAMKSAKEYQQVVYIPLDSDSQPSRSFYVVFPRQKNRRTSVKDFINYIKSNNL